MNALAPGFRADQLLISCEHATNRLPSRYGRLGLAASDLRSHIAWDPGAETIARTCASRLGRALYAGRYSRLLIDLNRSPHHRKLIPRVSFGVKVPGNAELDADERQRRVEAYYRPYRQRVMEEVESIIAAAGSCIHLSFHSFTPVLHGVVRRADIGLLYDPTRSAEKAAARAAATRIAQAGFHVRLNYPYRGTNDGFTTFCRRRHPPARYLGIEIEANQRLLASKRDTLHVANQLADCLTEALIDAHG
jgi:predicted N-formylglutamate amidohydrolase